jgi:riboflavin synthase
MFTGLISAIGTLDRIETGAAGLEIRVTCDYSDIVPGESIAVNGVCLTARTSAPGFFTAAAIVTTLERTAMGHWKKGRRVNLERALVAGDRLGGHMLQGHIDCVGTVSSVIRRDDTVLIDISIPDDIWQLMAPRGSIAVDGVSLTVNEMRERGSVQVALIEYTLSHTALTDIGSGDEVHIEADIIAKHVRQLLAPYMDRLSHR